MRHKGNTNDKCQYYCALERGNTEREVHYPYPKGDLNLLERIKLTKNCKLLCRVKNGEGIGVV